MVNKNTVLSGILGTCMGLGIGLYYPTSPTPVPLVSYAGITAEKTEPPQPLTVLPQPRPTQKVQKKNAKKRSTKSKSPAPLSPTS